MSDHIRITEYLGNGSVSTRVRNRLMYDGITSMEGLYQKSLELGETGFDLFVRELRNIGDSGATLIHDALAKYRHDQYPHAYTGGWTIWTRNDSPEWLEHNAGCSDVLLTAGLPKAQAMVLTARLKQVYNDQNIEMHADNACPAPGTVGQKK